MRELIDLARSRGHGVVAWNETLRCQCRHMVHGPERRVAMDEHLLYAGLALCVADGWLADNDAALVALRLAPTFHGTLYELCAVVTGVLADPAAPVAADKSDLER
jgi:hypothetical protein